MTVQELREALDEYCPDPNEEVPLSLIIPDLTYVVAALEDYCGIAEPFGRRADPEVEWFISRANDSL